MIRYLILALALVGCGVLPHKRVEKQASLLQELADNYSALQPAGWTDTDECDALLFNSLRGTAGVPLAVEQAEDPEHPGRWYRRPISLPECYASGASTSTISRDMLIGLYWYAWNSGNSRIVADLWNYGASRDWFMGDGQLSGAGTVLNSNMIALLGRLCVRLDAGCSGNYESWSKVPLTYELPPTGFQRHLEALQILLLGEMDGQLPGYLVDRLRLHSEEQPNNPLFALGMVLYDKWNPGEIDARLNDWPTDHLPTSANWCSNWRVEAEGPGPLEPSGSRGWNPCPENNSVHSGGEILFLSRVLGGKD